ncbi:MAG: DUF402 domain-containing protein [Nocardioides sp.]|nr:DUF402 domain-containing protein [Nocardioides sp.]
MRLPAAGDAIRVEMTKWGGRPHWEFDALFLGSDEHGEWIGLTTGTSLARPGAVFVTETDQVGLVPRDAGWVATFHAPGYLVTTYVDMTTVPHWDGSVVHAVDLDLDVVRGAQGNVWVDDEDEFAEHRVRFAYPPDVVALAEASAAWVHDAVLHERAPYDGASSAPWFEVLRRQPTYDGTGARSASGPDRPDGVQTAGPPGAGPPA